MGTVTLEGLTVADNPVTGTLGFAVRVTGPLKPFRLASPMLEDEGWPAWTFTGGGTLIAKSIIENCTVVEFVREPSAELPLTVTA